MRERWMTTALIISAVVAGAALVARSDESPLASFDYEVTAVDGKLLQEQPLPERRMKVGDLASSGAQLRTGWSSSAELLVEAENTRFKLASRTRVTLASERPGVLLEVSKGRMRADFGPLSGEPHERIVTTPSAVLAVRGTEYAIQVDSKGNTTLTVFEGEVEVMDVGRIGPPQRVAAGAGCAIPKGGAAGMPYAHGMTPGDWDRGRSMAPPSSPGKSMGGGRPMAGGGGTPHHAGGGR